MKFSWRQVSPGACVTGLQVSPAWEQEGTEWVLLWQGLS